MHIRKLKEKIYQESLKIFVSITTQTFSRFLKTLNFLLKSCR